MNQLLSLSALTFFFFSTLSQVAADDRKLLEQLISFPYSNPGLSVNANGKVAHSPEWQFVTHEPYSYYNRRTGPTLDPTKTTLVVKGKDSNSIEHFIYMRKSTNEAVAGVVSGLVDLSLAGRGLIRAIFMKDNNIDFIATCKGIPDYPLKSGKIQKGAARCAAINREICRKIYGSVGAKTPADIPTLKEKGALKSIYANPEVLKSFQALFTEKSHQINEALKSSAGLTGGTGPAELPKVKTVRPKINYTDPKYGYDEYTVLSLCEILHENDAAAPPPKREASAAQ